MIFCANHRFQKYLIIAHLKRMKQMMKVKQKVIRTPWRCYHQVHLFLMLTHRRKHWSYQNADWVEAVS